MGYTGFMIFIAFIFGILFTIFSFVSPKKALLLLVALLPLYGLRFSFLGFPTTLLEVLIWSTAIG